MFAALSVTAALVAAGALVQDARPDARPRARWWWNGPEVDEAELVRELDALAAAGLGGVEIVPVAHPEADPAAVVTWLSPEWNRLVRLAAEAARERGLAVDVAVGTGWPSGGDWLAGDERLQALVSELRALRGPARVDLVVTDLAGDDPLVGLWLLPDPCGRVEDVRDLRASVADGRLTLELGAGTWSLVALTRREGHGRVVHGAPGGRGAVLDHFDAGDVEAYLTRVTDALGDAPVDALFVDSLELGGADWTEDFPERFRSRRGYDLGPWLPALVGGAPATGALARDLPRVRHDRARTLAEAAADFGRTLDACARRRGLSSRLQAYGSPWLYGLLDLYATADVPEGDAWLFQAGARGGPLLDGTRAVLWNRAAASAAHQGGRRVVSTEAFTNTRGVFRATLADLKQATDVSLAMGVNRFVLHGVNHSPPGAGVPGRVRYGTWFDPANPWWPHLAHWTAGATRACALFLATAPTERIAVVGPTADVWSEHGLDRAAYATTPPYLHGLWTAFSAAGCSADALSHAALAGARVEGGRLHVGAAAYEALVLVEVRSLAAEAAEVCARFAEADGRVLAVGRAPERDPGLADAAARDARVRAAAARLAAADGHRELHPPEAAPAAAGELARDAALLAWAREALDALGIARDLDLDAPHPRLLTARRRGPDGRDAWFVANVSRAETLAVRATLPGEPGWPRALDLETGAVAEAAAEGPTRTLALVLGPLESRWVTVGSEPAAARPARPWPNAPARTLGGPWSVALDPMPGAGEPRALELAELSDLAALDGLSGFSGRAEYRLRFRVAPGERWDALDLGRVHGSAEVRVDGRTVVRAWGRRVVDGPFEPGEHALAVRVLTTAWNHLRTSDAPSARFHARGGGPPEPAGLLGPVRLLRRE